MGKDKPRDGVASKAAAERRFAGALAKAAVADGQPEQTIAKIIEEGPKVMPSQDGKHVKMNDPNLPEIKSGRITHFLRDVTPSR